MISDEIKTLNTIQQHRETVETLLTILAQDFAIRGRVHDRSKLKSDEFDGYIHINRAARKHAFDSPELREVKRNHIAAIDHHYARNSHHPEYHKDIRDMGFMDIIEMVIDWKAASITYGNQTLREGLSTMRERHDFSDAQWWLIDQVVEWLEE